MENLNLEVCLQDLGRLGWNPIKIRFEFVNVRILFYNGMV